MPKVLFTASTYSHILNFHIPYLREFQKQGWTVHTACGGSPTPLPFVDEAAYLPLKKSMTAPENFWAAVLLRKKIKSENYDLICTHTALAAYFTRLAVAGLVNRPKVANMIHGYLFDDQTPYFKRQILTAAERLSTPQTDLLLTMNQWDYDTARRLSLGKEVIHIPGVGVDFSRLDYPQSQPQELRMEYGIPPNAFVLLYMAEFSKRKNQAMLIRAMTRLPEYVVLVLAGDGALLKECQKIAERTGVTHRVVFPGYVQDAAAWYNTADAAVSSSRSEGLPFNIMEAMYAGLPVVASRVKGHIDLIKDGWSGLLFSFGDEAAFAEQILRLLDSDSLCRSLAYNAQSVVSQFSLENVLPVVWEHYQALIPVAAAVKGNVLK